MVPITKKAVPPDPTRSGLDDPMIAAVAALLCVLLNGVATHIGRDDGATRISGGMAVHKSL